VKRWLILALLTGCCLGQQWSGIISTSRAIDWSTVGIPGGIPSGSWTQCGSTIAAYGSSGTPASPSTINTAISGCSSSTYVLLGSGDFYLNGGITLKSNVVLRGAGPNNTRVHFSAVGGCNGWDAAVCMAGSNTYANGSGCGGCNEADWTGGLSQGSTSITLSSVTGITTNLTPIVLDQCETGLSGTTGTDTCTGSAADNSNVFVCDTASTCITQTANTGIYRTNRAQEEVVVATAISGTGPYTVTISPAIRNPNWASGQGPRAWWGTTTITTSGVENLLVDESTVGQRSVTAMMCNKCWIADVASTTANYYHFQNFLTVHDVVRDSYLYLSYSSATQSYGVGGDVSSDLLIENNIMQGVTDPIAFDASCAGCVAAFNFAVNQYYSPNLAYLFPMIQFHSAGTHMILSEGNIGAQILLDDIHGTHDLDTFFRNYMNGFESNNGTTTSKNTSPFGLSAFSRYMNVVGNVSGTASYHTTYQCIPASSSTVSCGAGQFFDIYDIGWASNTLGQSQGSNNDTLTAPTLFRWGNYDTVRNAVSWCGTSSDPGWSTTCGSTSEVPTGDAYYPNSVPSTTTLPPSFYSGITTPTTGCGTGLSFWKNPTTGTCPPYPTVGPDVSGSDILICTSGTYQNSLVLSNGQCSGGTSSAALSNYAYSNPAMRAYLNQMSGPPDGTGSMLTFNPAALYANDPASSGAASGAAAFSLRDLGIQVR
jgi:hypothetical protein